ncbi:MAG TPA: LacI family DNA-binding transcriptional regulator [Armatimonadota bacterium]|jgi:LacI family transcriptional regulator
MTIRQLAALAGVSIGTVSRALRNDTRISAPTRERVQQLALAYNYQPNRLTQAILTNTSHLLGVLVPDMGYYFWARICKGIHAMAFQESYQVITLETGIELSRIRAGIDALLSLRVDGILLMGSCNTQPVTNEALLGVWSRSIPLLTIDMIPVESEVDRVQCNEEQMAQSAVDYLITLGHQQIAYFGPTSIAQRRLAAVQRALALRKLDTSLLIDVPFTTIKDHSADEATDILTPLLQLRPIPTAVIAWEDYYALLLMKQCAQRGIRIPHDLSILGYANTRYCLAASPSLTSIEQHPEQLGTEAFHLLLKRMREGIDPANHTPEIRRFEGQLIRRGSCARPRVLQDLSHLTQATHCPVCSHDTA